MIIVVAVGMGMYFTGRCMVIEWAILHIRIDIIKEDDPDCEEGKDEKCGLQSIRQAACSITTFCRA